MLLLAFTYSLFTSSCVYFISKHLEPSALGLLLGSPLQQLGSEVKYALASPDSIILKTI